MHSCDFIEKPQKKSFFCQNSIIIEIITEFHHFIAFLQSEIKAFFFRIEDPAFGGEIPYDI